MIHNGIEYAEMQLIAECYALLKHAHFSNEQISALFNSWCDDVGSYLLQISARILQVKEEGEFLIDQILDKAGNKGTGKWSTATIANSGQTASLIPSALLARYIFFKEKRELAAQTYAISEEKVTVDINALKAAYRFSRIVNHHQGFALIAEVSKQEGWGIALSEVARIWTEGCIIKSDLMKVLIDYLTVSDELLMHPEIIKYIKKDHLAAKEIAATFLNAHVHAPCMIEAVNYFHGYTTARSSANLIQAQRDYFGAHTYQKLNDSSGKTIIPIGKTTNKSKRVANLVSLLWQNDRFEHSLLPSFVCQNCLVHFLQGFLQQRYSSKDNVGYRRDYCHH